MLNFNDFKSKINNMDKAFLSYGIGLDKIREEENTEINKAKKEIETYSANACSKNEKTLNDYLNTVNNLITKVKETKVAITKSNGNKTFNSYEDALNFLSENSDLIKKQLESINNYKFENSTFTYNIDGEEASINEKDYTAPDFPELSSSDFDTDPKYKQLLIDLYNLCLTHVSCLNYLLSFIKTTEYQKNVRTKEQSVCKTVTESITATYSSKLESHVSDFQNKYESDYSRFLVENNNKLNDYQTVDTIQMPLSFSDKINIGSLPYEFLEYNKYQSEVSKIDKNGYITEKIRFPYEIDLISKGNVLINTSANEEKVVELVHQLIMQFISSMPYKKTSLALVDIDNSEYDFVFNYSKEYLKKNNLLFTGNVITEEDHLKDLILSLNRKLTDIKGNKLSLKSCDNIFEYNELSKENSQEMYLLVLIDFPKHIDNGIAEKLSNLIKNGNKCGIFTIIVNNTSIHVSQDSYEYNIASHNQFIESCQKSSIVIDYSSKNKSFEIDKTIFTPNEAFSSRNINEFFKKLEIGSEEASSNQIIYLDSIMGVDYSKKPYYEQIKIPVGKDGGEPIFFELDVDGTGTSSALIAGGTGSGKSSFLHTIILSGAYNYSPEELEYYLIDFKDGVEFSPYSDNKNGINIPHISFLSLKNKVEDAYDILMKIYSEKNRRNEFFKKVNASDIKSYHNSPEVKSGKYPSFKRMIVIIDEYQNFLTSTDTSTSILCNKCAGLLLALLKEIRSVGISLVLSSQSVFVEREALDQIYNRYIFSSSATVLQTAFPEFSGDEMNNELNKEKGLVYKTKNGGVAKKLFKAAFSGKTNEKEQKGVAKQINAKWSTSVRNELTISGSESNIPLYSSLAPFVKFDEIELTEDNTIKTYFGQSAMSNELIPISFNDSDFCSYLILGEIKRTRAIEASIGLSFLYSLKKYDFSLDNKKLYYLDLNNSNDAIRNPSPFDLYKEQLGEVMQYSVETDDIINSINELYDEYLNRKEASRHRSREIKAPIMLIVNSFSCLDELESELNTSDAGEMDTNAELAALLGGGPSLTSPSDLSPVEKIKAMYLNGHTYNIFVIIQERRASVFNKYDNFVDLSKVICCDKNEIENCKMSENGGTVTITDLPANYVVLFPNVSKIRPFEFDKSKDEKQYIEKLVEVLIND